MDMKYRLKETFDQIKAEEELKNRTKVFVSEKIQNDTSSKAGTAGRSIRRLAPVFVCMAILLIGSYWLYFTPAWKISIDINPSIEISMNRLNKVISVKSYNEDGAELADLLDVKYKNYAEAICQILENDDIAALLSNDEILMIGVIGNDETQSSKILADIESLAEGKKNTYCYCVHSDEVSEAHKMGLSYGKYKAFLDLRALDPDITADDMRDMTMREIQDLIDELSGSQDNAAEKTGDTDSNTHHHTGKKHRNSYKGGE